MSDDLSTQVPHQRAVHRFSRSHVSRYVPFQPRMLFSGPDFQLKKTGRENPVPREEMKNGRIRIITPHCIFKFLKFREPDLSNPDEETCVICQDDLDQETVKIMILPCGHEYHHPCIRRWMDRQSNCPVCRARV